MAGAKASEVWTKAMTRSGGFARAGLQGVSVIAIRMGGAGLALAAQILASRTLGPEAFGRYSLLLVWLFVLGSAATAGSGQLVCRYVAQYVKTGDHESVAGLLRASLAVLLAVASLFAGVAIAILALAPLGLQSDDRLLGTFALSAIPLVALQDYLEGLARGLDKPALGIAPPYLIRHLAVIIGLLALLVLGPANALAVMGLTIGGIFASIVAQCALLRGPLRAMLLDTRPRYDLYRWGLTLFPMAGADVTGLLLLNSDVLILGLFVTPEYVAYYYTATRFAQILAYVPYGARAATAQKFAAHGVALDRAKLQVLIGKTAALSTIVAALGALTIVLFSGPLLSLFGAAYTEAAPVLTLLCLGIVVSCAFGPGEDVLNMLGEERICSVVFMVAFALNLGLNFAVIPYLGLAGAAIATGSTLAIRGALLAYFAKVRLDLVLPAFVASLLPAPDRKVPHERAAASPIFGKAD